MEDLRLFINKKPIIEDLADAIIDELQSWKDSTRVDIQGHRWSETTMQLISLQRGIGWELFLEGCIHREWASIIGEILWDTQSMAYRRRWISNGRDDHSDFTWEMAKDAEEKNCYI